MLQLLHSYYMTFPWKIEFSTPSMLILRSELSILSKYERLMFHNDENFSGVRNTDEIFMCTTQRRQHNAY